jgi:hypothetical protein
MIEDPTEPSVEEEVLADDPDIEEGCQDEGVDL